jgi:hypothetical protein
VRLTVLRHVVRLPPFARRHIELRPIKAGRFAAAARDRNQEADKVAPDEFAECTSSFPEARKFLDRQVVGSTAGRLGPA